MNLHTTQGGIRMKPLNIDDYGIYRLMLSNQGTHRRNLTDLTDTQMEVLVAKRFGVTMHSHSPKQQQKSSVSTFPVNNTISIY